MEFTYTQSSQQYLAIISPRQQRVQSPKPLKILGGSFNQSSSSIKMNSLYDSVSSNQSSPFKDELRLESNSSKMRSSQFYSSPSPNLISQEIVSQVNQERENSLNPHEKDAHFSEDKLNLTPEQILKDLQSELESMNLSE